MSGWSRDTPPQRVNELEQQLAEARAKLNEIDLCRMGQAPCAVLLDTYRQLDEARAALNDFAWLVDAIYDFDSLALVVPGFNKWHERYTAALKAAREKGNGNP